MFNSGPSRQHRSAARACALQQLHLQCDWRPESRWFTAPRPAAAAWNRAATARYIKYGTFRSEVEMKDVFARFSLDLGESANWYVQGSWAQAENASDWIQWVVSPNASRPNTLFANNPFLTADHAGDSWARASSAELPPRPAGAACRPRRRPRRRPAARRRRRRPTPFFTAPSYLNTVDGQRSQRRARTACIARSAIRRRGMRKPASPVSWAVSTGTCTTTTATASSRSPTPTTPTTPSIWPRWMR